MGNIISKKLKDIRLEKGMTQSELAKGICTQAMISNFESGESIPSSLVLYQISKKLKVNINYFFEENIEEFTNDNNEIKRLIENLLRRKDYESIYYIIKNEKEKSNFIAFNEKQFLLWNEILCEYYLSYVNAESSIKRLEDMISNSIKRQSQLTFQDINIINSLANLYFESENYELALKKYKLCLNKYEESNISDYLMQLKLLYGYARALGALDKMEESILNIKQAVRLAIKNETLYLLGELYFQWGRNLIKLNNNQEALKNLSIAETLFTVQKNEKYLDIVHLLIKEIN